MNNRYEKDLGYTAPSNDNATQIKIETKKLKAFFTVPILIPLTFAVLTLFFGKSSSIMPGEQVAMLIFLIGIPITYLSVLILGMPIYIILEDTNKLSYLSLFLSGSLTSSIVTFAIATEGRFSFKGMTGVPENFLMILIFTSIVCGITAILFGKVAKGI